MTSVRNQMLALAAAFLLSASASSSLAQTIAGEDFDGGTTNGGFTSASVTLYEGDFDTATSTVHDDTFNGLFDFGAGSFFDRFGTVNATDPSGLPFDMVDGSGALGTFAIDRFGVLSEGVDNNAIGFADTLNGTNIDSTGLVSGQWTFDISSGSNMQLSIDFAAVGAFDNNDGGFETDDFMTFTYSIDGGATQTAFDVRPEGSPGGPLSNEFYTVTMDGGDTYDRYFIPSAFFDVTAWTTLTTTGPFGAITFHPDDTDQDGYVDLEGALATEATRALTSGSFDNTELEVFKNPLIVNGGTAEETKLDNDFQTVTVPITGSGNTLTLKLLSVADGSLEYSFFDNILIEEASAGITGDFDNDGDVDGADFLEWQRQFPTLTASDLNDWENAYGTPLSALSAVPEPTSIGLIGVALAMIFTRRGRRA